MKTAEGRELDGYISIVRLSPYNLPDARRRYTVIKAYFDGRNKSHETGIMTLAALAAPESLWPLFETAWGAMLQQHGLRWWHSSDAMSFNRQDERDFLIEAGHWTPDRAHAAYNDLYAVISRFWKEHWHHTFQWFTCCIDLSAYRQVQASNRLLRPAEAICVNECLTTLVVENDAALLYFDRGETFMKEVEQIWRRDRKKAFVKWAQQVKDILPVNAQEYRPIQAADLLAWRMNQGSQQFGGWRDPGPIPMEIPEKDQLRIYRFLGRTYAYYGVPEIERFYTPEGERERVERIASNKRRTRETRILDQIRAEELARKPE